MLQDTMTEITPYNTVIKGAEVHVRSLTSADAVTFIRLVSSMGFVPSDTEITAGFYTYPRGYIGAFTTDGTMICKLSTCTRILLVNF